MKHFFHLLFLLCAPYALFAMEISPSEAEKIGRGIFLNECGGNKNKLVWWNEGENFASLGIGHFIWYPKGVRGPYEETFPSLLIFLENEGVTIPSWLSAAEGCPWESREEFLKQSQDGQKKELQELLLRTIAQQTTFIGKRFEEELRGLLTPMNDEEQKAIRAKIESLEKSLQGKFALIDYLHFKGAGTCETERYNGKGWGLKQVLEEMPASHQDPLLAFAETAKRLLRMRVEGAPSDRKEERWLPGWIARVDRYLKD